VGRLNRWCEAILQGSFLLPGAALDAGYGGVAASSAARVSLDWIARF
jgi:hypothetical protein